MSLPKIINDDVDALWRGVFGEAYSVKDVLIFYEAVCDKLKATDDRLERKRFRALKRRIESDLEKTQIQFTSEIFK